MATAEYEVGDRVRLAAAFTVNGTATDPTTVTFTVKKPDGTTTINNTPSHDSTGNYHIDVDLDMAETWYWRVAGTGTATAAGEQALFVKHSQVLA